MESITDFENIGGPWQAANEPWRLRRAAQARHHAAARQRTPAPLGEPTRVEQIIQKGKMMRHLKRTHGPSAPHIHLELYQKDYERVYGAEKAQQIIDNNRIALEALPPPVQHTAKWKPSESNWNHPAIQMLQTAYYSKCIRPPIDVRLNAHKQAGYPQAYLLEMLKAHETELSEKPENDAWFDRVFGPYLNKKETVPKPRTLTQIFKIKVPKAIKPDEDTDDEPEGDDE